MSDVVRFRGAAAALLALLAVGTAWWWTTPYEVPPDVEAFQPALFRFEKEDVVGIEIVRPTETIALRQVDGVWQVGEANWRPSRSMVRRVAYQMHDLTARAVVAEGVTDFDAYGVGDGAITVTLTLKDGRTVRFAVGDPNPTGVSWYIRPLPGDAVYTVKKAALDYFGLTLSDFRETRFAWLDADAADAIEATVDGRTQKFVSVGDRKWRMTEPIDQPADTDAIRTMLGRTGALKAISFIADAPTDKAQYGLDEPVAHLVIHQGTGETVTLDVGAAQVPESTDATATSPDEVRGYVYRAEDDAVYLARIGFLEAYRKSPAELRDKTILGRHPWDVRGYTVVRADGTLEITHGKDEWRWPDGSPAPGATPERVASAVGESEAKAFFDTARPDPTWGLDPTPWATVTLRFDDGEAALQIGAETPDGLRYVRIPGAPTVYAVDPQVASTIDDLFREWGRAQER